MDQGASCDRDLNRGPDRGRHDIARTKSRGNLRELAGVLTFGSRVDQRHNITGGLADFENKPATRVDHVVTAARGDPKSS